MSPILCQTTALCIGCFLRGKIRCIHGLEENHEVRMYLCSENLVLLQVLMSFWYEPQKFSMHGYFAPESYSLHYRIYVYSGVYKPSSYVHMYIRTICTWNICMYTCIAVCGTQVQITAHSCRTKWNTQSTQMK